MPGERVDFKHVREHASFEPVIAHYGLVLQGKGDQRSTLCCFHQENTGSLKINLGKKIFNCFGCGAKGNILDFVTLKEGGDPENTSDLRRGALKLAEICGIDPSARGRRAMRPPETRQDGQKAPAPNEVAPSPEKPSGGPPSPSQGIVENKPLSFRLQLDATHPYLATRGLKRETLEAIGIGHCGRGLMKGLIAIPIHNEKAELIAYAGRWAEKEVPADTPRYLLPEGFGKQTILFNLHRAVTRSLAVTFLDVMVIAESYWSVMKLDELGFPAVSPMGHSEIGRAHV